MSYFSQPIPAEPQMSMTVHAEARCRQRAIKERDLGLLLRHATDNGDGTLTMTPADIADAVAALKRQIAAFEKLRGATAVVLEGKVVTVYRSTKSRRPRRHHDIQWEN